MKASRRANGARKARVKRVQRVVVLNMGPGQSSAFTVDSISTFYSPLRNHRVGCMASRLDYSHQMIVISTAHGTRAELDQPEH
jgi:hypothetical protein